LRETIPAKEVRIVAELVGASKYRVEPAQQPLGPGMKMIVKADAISIYNVLSDFFQINVPADNDFKTYCPFVTEHGDGGADKGWRTYPDTNSSYCFIMHGVMGPVRLIQNLKGLSSVPAAEFLLGHYDMLKPLPWRDRFEALRVEREQQDQEGLGSPQDAVEALHMALNRVPGYLSRQFDPDVQQAMEVVMGLLNTVFQRGLGVDALRLWHRKSVAYITRAVEGTS
jgi:hypothetical protein